MSYLLTFLLTLAVVLVAVLLMVKVGVPTYRLEKKNVIRLLELVLEGKATVNDWEVFMGVPIRHNEQLESVRRRCGDIAKTEYTGTGDRLFTDRGLRQLADILAELKEQ